MLHLRPWKNKGKTMVKPDAASEALEKQMKKMVKPDATTEDLKKQSEYWKQIAELHDKSWEATETIEIEEPDYKSQAFKQNLKREAHLEVQTEVVANKFDDGQGGYKKADPYDDDVIKRTKVQQTVAHWRLLLGIEGAALGSATPVHL